MKITRGNIWLFKISHILQSTKICSVTDQSSSCLTVLLHQEQGNNLIFLLFGPYLFNHYQLSSEKCVFFSVSPAPSLTLNCLELLFWRGPCAAIFSAKLEAGHRRTASPGLVKSFIVMALGNGERVWPIAHCGTSALQIISFPFVRSCKTPRCVF